MLDFKKFKKKKIVKPKITVTILDKCTIWSHL